MAMVQQLTPADLSFSSPPVARFPLLERLKPVADAGFRALSVQPGDIWSLEAQGLTAAEIAARVADAGLVITELDCTACWMPHQMHTEQVGGLTELLRGLTSEKIVATAARIGAQSVSAIDVSIAPAPFDEAAESFARLCSMAADHGLKAQIEFLPVGGIRSFAEALAIVQASGSDNGGLTLDAWHFFRSGSTLEELAKVPGHRIHAVQLCDAPAEPTPDAWSELMSARLLPGEGDLDLAGLVRTLDSIGCTAPTGVEVFHTRQDAMTLAQIARDWAQATKNLLANARSAA
jgi:sugar phosphate isomerase/epimerase